METFENWFDTAFYKQVHCDSFRLPMSVKELKIFTKHLCKEAFLCMDKNIKYWSEDSTIDNLEQPSAGIQNKELRKDTPIGLNSLSKTFNIIKVVGQGSLVFSKRSLFFLCPQDTLERCSKLKTSLITVCLH